MTPDDRLQLRAPTLTQGSVVAKSPIMVAGRGYQHKADIHIAIGTGSALWASASEEPQFSD
jgi:hypothetical protein